MIHTPNFMRFMRVDKILRSDKALSRKLSQPSYPIEKTDGSGTELFSREVVGMTRLIHDEGHDVQTMPKPTLMRYAVELLVTGTRKMPELAVPASKPPKPPEPPKKPASVDKVETKKKVAVKKVAVKKTAKTKAVAVDAKSPVTPVPTPTEAFSAGASSNGNHAPAENEEDERNSTDRFKAVSSKGPFPFVVGSAAVSNIMAGCQLLRAYGEGAYDDIAQRLDTIIEEIQATAKIPNSAKSR